MTRLATVINKIIDIINTKQPTLVSGENIKKLNNTSLLGEGDISVKTVGGQSVFGEGDVSVKTLNGESLVGSGDSSTIGTGTLTTTSQNVIGAINEHENGKATKAELTSAQATLNGRIDNIIAGGTAPSEAEIIDARQGADGTNYVSLGGAIRGQVTGLKSDLTNVEDNLGYELKSIANGYSDAFSGNTSASSSPFIFPNNIYQSDGKRIGAIKLKVVRAGKLSIGYINKDSSFSGAYDPSLVTVKDVITFPQTGEQTVWLNEPFTVPSGCTLIVGQSTDTAVWTYGSVSGIVAGFYYISSGSYAYSSSSIGIELFSYEGINVSDIEEYTDSIKPSLKWLDRSITNLVYYDGYNVDNAWDVSYSTSPFIIAPVINGGGYVDFIKLKVASSGRLSIGTINKTYVYYGASFDIANVSIHEVINLAYSGEQTIYLKESMEILPDEYIVLGMPTDTAIFKYGSYGVDNGFYYVQNGEVKASSSSIGITFSGSALKATNDSAYSGKSISILGDSISTFNGYIPEDNATYYPSGTVTAVTDTWWKKLIDALGAELEINNSWSGSRVTTTGGATSAGCGDRCEALGTDPDVIIVWMGINDFNNEVAIGTYDGTTAIPTTTTTFREAYAIMLNKILTKYQSSEVWVCTLPQCERNAEAGFPEINGNDVALAEFNKAILELATAFGVKVLDHNKCGLTYQNMPTYNPDNLHPNKYGHSLIANNDIRQMDNFVRTRY